MDSFLAFRNLFRNTRRTMAILAALALGAGSLFSFNAFIKGVLEEYREATIHSHYGYGQITKRGYREKVFEEPINQWIEESSHLQNFLLNLEEVETIFPRASFSALLKKGNITVSGSGLGIEAEKESTFFHSLNVEEGESLSHQPNGIFLGKGLADALNVHPGDSVTVMLHSSDGIASAPFIVTGIFHTGVIDFDSRMFRIQLKEAHKLLNTSRIELMSLALRNLTDWDHVARAVENAFPELEAVSFDILDKVYYKNSVDWLNAQFHIVQIIILSIVCFSIFNTISTAILERKQEIGNLRANGESVFQVMKLIMMEGAFLALLGSGLGIFLAYLILNFFLDQGILMPPAPGMTRQFFASFKFELSMVLFTLMFSTIASLVASFLAGIRVAKMPIAKALQN